MALIPRQSDDVIDKRTGKFTTPWYRFFEGQTTASGGLAAEYTVNQTTVQNITESEDSSDGIGALRAELAQLRREVEALKAGYQL